MDGVKHQPQLVAQTDPFAYILKIDQLDALQPRQLVSQFGLFDKGA